MFILIIIALGDMNDSYYYVNLLFIQNAFFFYAVQIIKLILLDNSIFVLKQNIYMNDQRILFWCNMMTPYRISFYENVIGDLCESLKAFISYFEK